MQEWTQLGGHFPTDQKQGLVISKLSLLEIVSFDFLNFGIAFM